MQPDRSKRGLLPNGARHLVRLCPQGHREEARDECALQDYESTSPQSAPVVDPADPLPHETFSEAQPVAQRGTQRARSALSIASQDTGRRAAHAAATPQGEIAASRVAERRSAAIG